MSAWYAVWTRSRHESRVCQHLDARGVTTFLPTCARLSRWSDRQKRISWPLFPGYCFARGEREDLHHVSRCPGVASVLSTAGAPAPVADEEIDALMRLVRTDLAYEPCIPRTPGLRVRVVRGPLAGVQGQLIRGQRDSQLLLAVDLLNSAARLTISEWDVEPAPLESRRRAADGALCRA